MKRLLSLLFSLLLVSGLSTYPLVASSACSIAFDAASEGTGSGTLTIAHTVTGTNTALFVGFFIQKNPDPGITSVTFNGVAMTATADSPVNEASNIHVYMYTLLNPATGTHNVVITPAGAVDADAASNASYTCVSQTGFPDSHNLKNNTSATTNTTIPFTTVADNAWLVAFFRNEAGNGTDGTATTHRTSQGDHTIADSGGAKTPPGSFSLIQNFTSAVNSAVGVSFAPAQSTVTFNFWQFFAF